MTKHYTSKGTLLIRNSDIKDGRFEFGEEPIYLDEYFAKENLLRMHKIGDVITVHTGDVGTSAVIGEKEENSIGFATIVTRPNSQIIDSNYLSTFLNTDKHKKWAVAISTGDGRTNYNLGDYYKLTIPLPILQEQKAIATFITKINNLITLHQRKYFCSNNLIFTITTAWEQRKLWEIANIVGGGTPSTSISEYWNGDIDWYAPAEMEGKRYANGSAKKITKLGLQNCSAQILPAGRTILFTSRAGIGKMAILKRPGSTNQGFQSLVLNQEINPYFIYSLCDEIKEKAESVAAGSTFLEISGKALGNIEILMPKELEQNKVSNYFLKLDNLITLHQRECFFIKKEVQNVKFN